MSTHDRNSDAEETSAWPGTQPAMPPPTVPQSAGTPGWPPAAPAGGGWSPPIPPGMPPTPPGMPPAGYGQPQQPTPQPSHSGRALLAVIAVVAVLGAVAAVVFLTPVSHTLFGPAHNTAAGGSTSSSTSSSTTTSTTTSSTSATTSATSTAPATRASAPPPAGGIVDPSSLQSYLATPDELAPRFDGATMEPKGLSRQPFTGIDVVPFKCSGAAIPGIDSAYGGSGFTGFVGQVVNDATNDHKLIQALISFPTANDASTFVMGQVDRWRECNYKDLSITINNKVDHITAGVVADHGDGTYSMLMFPPKDASAHQCERALTARGNVVVDVRACTSSVGSLGYTIARDIGQKITGQR